MDVILLIKAAIMGVVELKSKTPVKYSMESVVVMGNFAVLVNDPFGVYYKIVDAALVK